MKCFNCGCENTNEAIYCKECGKKMVAPVRMNNQAVADNSKQELEKMSENIRRLQAIINEEQQKREELLKRVSELEKGYAELRNQVNSQSHLPMMRYCRKCDETFDEATLFCPFCGESL